MDFRRTLVDVGRRLDGADCAWAVIGGVALGVHGVPRATVDVDLLVEEGCALRLPALLEDLGYSLRFQWEESSHLACESAGYCLLDVLHAHRPHSLGMLRRARRVPLEGGDMSVPVVQVEDLMGLKVQAMINDPERRRGELVDMRALMEAAASRQERIDLDRIREYFALFGQEAELEELLGGLADALA